MSLDPIFRTDATRLAASNLSRTFDHMRELRKNFDSVRELQEQLHRKTCADLSAVSEFQRHLKSSAEALRAFGTNVDALRSLGVGLPASTLKPKPAPAPKRGRRPATAGYPEVDASQKACREWMRDRLRYAWVG